MIYTVFELSGKQYLIRPGETIEIDKISDLKKVTTDKILLNVDGGKVELGKPYLKKNLSQLLYINHCICLENMIYFVKFKFIS